MSYKQMVRLALPVIATQSVVLINSMTDLAFIAPYGTDAIAAVAIANTLCATLLNFLEGFRLGTTILVSEASTTNNPAKAAVAVNSGIFLAATIGGILLVFAPSISHWVYIVSENGQMAYHGTTYLTIWLCTMPLILLSFVLTGLFRGLKDTATPFYSALIICLLNIILAYALVGGGFGFPRLGVKGAAWGTLLANLTGVCILLFLAVKKPLTRQAMNWRQPFIKQIREYVKLAVDVGLNTGFTLLALLLFVCIIKPLGTAALAVHQITLQVFNFTYLPAVGFLITASIIVPRILETEPNLLVSTVIRLCKMSFVTALVISGLLLMFSHTVGNFFSPADMLVAKQATATLQLVCAGQLFSSIYLVLRGTLTGCRDTRFIVYEGLVSGYLVFLPLAYWLALKLGYGIYGGYIAFLAWCIIDCAALAWRFYQRRSTFRLILGI